MNNHKWRSLGATLRSTYHLEHSIPNQDAFAVMNMNSLTIAAVSDGLGSKPHSDTGSKLACSSVCDVLASARIHPLSPTLSAVYSRWSKSVSLAGFSLDDSCATCLFAVVRNGVVSACRLGDGFIAVCLRNGRVKLLADNKDGSFINVTDCLSPEHSFLNWECVSFSAYDVIGVVLCTDGVAVEPQLACEFARSVCLECSRMNDAHAEREIASWLEILKHPGIDDDRTLACIIRR